MYPNFPILFFLLLCCPKPSYQVGDVPVQEPFCYSNATCGPTSKLWDGLCQTGKSQSPINLVYNPNQRTPAIGAQLTMSHPFVGNSFRIRNNGHTVAVSFPEVDIPTCILQGTIFNNTYRFNGIHFHWGPSIAAGSEHSFNGKHYALEMHIVHYNAKFPTLHDAVVSNEKDAIAVLGFFLEAKPGNRNNEALAPFLRNIPTTYQPQHAPINQPYNIQSVIPKPGALFLSYSGSLTTPKCTEDVLWQIFIDPIQVSIADVMRFRGIRKMNSNVIRRNVRPIQELNGRQVTLMRLEQQVTAGLTTSKRFGK